MPKSQEAKALIEQAIEEIKKKKGFDKDAGALLASIEEGLLKSLSPAMEKMMGQIAKSMAGLKIDAPKFDMPQMELDMSPVAEAIREAVKDAFKGIKIDVPAPQVTVNPSKVEFPQMPVFPEFPKSMRMDGYDSKNPMPVLLHGVDGKPILNFGGSGSKANFLTIKNILTGNGDSVMDDTNDAIRVNVVTGSITSTPGLQISGAADSMNVIQLGGNAISLGSGVDAAGVLRVVHATDVGLSVTVSGFTATIGVVPQTPAGSDITDETNDALRVNVVAGSTSGTQYTEDDDPTAGTIVGNAMLAEDEDYLRMLQVGSGRDSLALRIVHATNVGTSVEIASQQITLDVKQVSGGNSSVNVVSFNSVVPAVGTNETTDGFLRVVQPTDFTGSVNVSLLGGLAINLGAGAVGTGTQRVVIGNDSTVMVVGSVVADAADDGSAPQKVGGIARQANPTAVAGNDRVSATFDDLGRQVMRINQVRDLIQTAYATLSTGTETTLLASASGVFSDLIYIMGANDSSVAVQVDIRAATGANKVLTLEIPANGTAGVSLPIPLPQDVAADTWTADMPDITGTNVYISALFSKEV